MKKKKQQEYKTSLTEREKTNNEISSFNKYVEKHNKAQYIRIKSEQTKNKEDELRKHKHQKEEAKKMYMKIKDDNTRQTEKLKEEMEELERLEEEYMQTLKSTKQKVGGFNLGGGNHTKKMGVKQDDSAKKNKMQTKGKNVKGKKKTGKKDTLSAVLILQGYMGI